MKIFCFLTACAADRFTPENSVLMQSLIKQGIRGAGFTSRRGDAKCQLRETETGVPTCCATIDLECFGCHPVLLSMGIPCSDQTTSGGDGEKRDCFCDSSCILFEDCCSDHRAMCPDLYTSSTKQTATTTIKSRSTTTTSATTSTTTSFTITNELTTAKAVQTTAVPTESWIFIKLFQTLSKLTKEKFKGDTKWDRMKLKIEHIHQFLLNAEHNCRLQKQPLPGLADDGSVTTYDDIWADTKKGSVIPYAERMTIINGGFQRYMNEYYWEAPTSEFIQGCDGAQSTGVYRGIHYKMKRYTRKVMKAIKKINRRRLATETNKDD